MNKEIILEHDWLDNQQRMYLGKTFLQYLVDCGIHADSFSYAIAIRYTEQQDPQSGDDRTQSGEDN